MTGNQDTDGVLIGTRWDTLQLTFSFPTSASFYEAGYGGEPGSGFKPLNAMQMTAAREGFAMVSALTHLSFTEVTETATRHADLRHASSNLPGTAWAYYPAAAPSGGDVWYNGSGSYDVPILGSYAYFTFLHEIGHSLGLKHGHEVSTFGPMTPDHDSHEYSIMTYRSYVGSQGQYYTNETWGGPQTFMISDIAALQHMYGADYAMNAGDTTYRWSPDTGQMSLNGVAQAMPGGNRILRTVWDGGGDDTYDLSNYSGAVTIDLRPGEWTTTSAVQLANLGDGHFARGNIGNALLHDGDVRSLIENAIGAGGDDTLYGNVAGNLLDGRGGTDTVVLAGAQGDYVFAGEAGSFTAAGFGVTDSILNAEFVRFLGSGIVVASSELFTDEGSPDDYRDGITDGSSPLGALSAGAPRTGRIEAAGDRDVFAISLKASSDYTFELRGAPTGGGTLGDAVLELRDSKGVLLLSNDDFNSADATLVFRAKTTGTYYLSAGGDDGSTGSYTLSALRGFDDHADKPSDTSAPMGKLAIGGTRMGAIERSGDVDYFAVRLDAGESYDFDMRGAPSDSGTLPNALLELRDSTGRVLLTNNDFAGSRDSHIDYTAATDGTYYLSARGSGSNIGTYSLSASSAPSGRWACAEEDAPVPLFLLAGAAHADYHLPA